MAKFKEDLRKLKVDSFKVNEQKSAEQDAQPVFFQCSTFGGNCGTNVCGVQQCSTIGGVGNCQNCSQTSNCGGCGGCAAGCGGCGVGLSISCGNCGGGGTCGFRGFGGYGYRGRY